MRASELKEICENIKIYYYNSRDSCWYFYNVSTKEYKRFCKEKWEHLGTVDDFEYLEGVGIWVRIDKGCNEMVVAAQSQYYPSCESDTQRGQPDESKCEEGNACVYIPESQLTPWRCVPCEEINSRSRFTTRNNRGM